MGGDSLYQRILGPSYNGLPEVLKRVHDARPLKRYRGQCRVERGTSVLARMLAVIARLPPGSQGVPVEVTIAGRGRRENWARRFGMHRMNSVLWQHGRFLEERLGAVTLRFELAATSQGISWTLRGARFLFIPLPAAWFSACIAHEAVDGERYLFEVHAAVRGAGLLVRYSGWMTEHDP